MRSAFFLSVGALASAAFLAAGNPGGSSSAKPLDDATILGILGQVNDGEVEMGKLAQQKASETLVQNYGRKLVDDHTRAKKEAEALAKEINITPQPPEDDDLSRDHAKVMEELSQKSGAEFDRAFLDAAVDGHKQVIKMASEEWIPQARNEDLKAFIHKQLPGLLEHQKLAEMLKEEPMAASERRERQRVAGPSADSTENPDSAQTPTDYPSPNPANSGAGGARPPDTVGKEMPANPR